MEGTRHPHHSIPSVSAWQAQQYSQQQQQQQQDQQQQQQDFQHSRYQPHLQHPQQQQQEFHLSRYHQQQQQFLSQSQSQTHPQIHIPVRPQPLTHARPQPFHPGSGPSLLTQPERLGSITPLPEDQQEPQLLTRHPTQQVEDFPQLFQQIQKQLSHSGKQQGAKSFPLSQFQPSSVAPGYVSPTTQVLPNASHSSGSLQSSSSTPPLLSSPISLTPARIQPLNAPIRPTVHSHSGALFRERNGIEDVPSKPPASSDPSHSHPLPSFMNPRPPQENRSQPNFENALRLGSSSSNIMMPKNQADSEAAYVGSESRSQMECEDSSTSGGQFDLPLCDDPSTLADELESTLGSVSSFPDGPLNSQSEREEDSNQSCSQDGSLPDSRPPGAFCIDSLLSDSTQKSTSGLPKNSSSSSVDSITGKRTLAESSKDNQSEANVNGNTNPAQDQTNQSDSNDARSGDDTSQSSDMKVGRGNQESSNLSASKEVKSSENSALQEAVRGESSDDDESTSREVRSTESSDVPVPPSKEVRNSEKSGQSPLKEVSGESSQVPASKEVESTSENTIQPDSKAKEVEVRKESIVPSDPPEAKSKEEKSSLSDLKRMRMCDLRSKESRGDRFKILDNMEEGRDGAALFQQEGSIKSKEGNQIKDTENLTEAGRQTSTQNHQSRDKESSSSVQEASQSSTKDDGHNLTKETNSSEEGSQSSNKEVKKSTGTGNLMIKPLKDLMDPAPVPEPKQPDTTPLGKSHHIDPVVDNVTLVNVPSNLVLTGGPLILPTGPAATTLRSLALPSSPSLTPSLVLPCHSALPKPNASTGSAESASTTATPTQDPLSTIDPLTTGGDKDDNNFHFVEVNYTPESEPLREASDPLNHDPFMMEDIKPSILIPEVVLKTEPEDTDDSPNQDEAAWDYNVGRQTGKQAGSVARNDRGTARDRSNRDPGTMAGEEAVMDNDDRTHFFETNECQFVDGRPLKVTCHVCDVSVGSRLFKHHLFFGHLQCQYCNRKLVGCDMLNDINNSKKNACGRSKTQQHCFRRWSLDPIEFLSYYIRKELVIKRFCAGKQGPPPVSDIIQEIEAYIGRLSDLCDLSPWKLAIAKCFKYINERKPGAKERLKENSNLGSFPASPSGGGETRRVWPVPKYTGPTSTPRPSTAVTSSSKSASNTWDVLSQMRQKVTSEIPKTGAGGEASREPSRYDTPGPARSHNRAADRSEWAESLQRHSAKKAKEPANLNCSCSRALTETILKTVFPRQPPNDYYLVVHYPTHPVPEVCPSCYGHLDAATVAVNASNHVITICCPDCELTIYIAQDPPGTPVPVQAKRKESPGTSSLTPPLKTPKLS